MANKRRLGCPLGMANETMRGSARGRRGRGGGANGGTGRREWCRSCYYRWRCNRRRCCHRRCFRRRCCRHYRGLVFLCNGGYAAGPRRNTTLEIARHPCRVGSWRAHAAQHPVSQAQCTRCWKWHWHWQRLLHTVARSARTSSALYRFISSSFLRMQNHEGIHVVPRRQCDNPGLAGRDGT